LTAIKEDEFILNGAILHREIDLHQKVFINDLYH